GLARSLLRIGKSLLTLSSLHALDQRALDQRVVLILSNEEGIGSMIIFALRHADRAPDADDLSQAGQERAKLLARMLAESGVSIAYRSDAVRAARTLGPLELRLGAALTVEEIGFPDPDGVAAHIATIVKKIQALPDNAVVAVVSHSNTVGPILQKLGAGFNAQIADKEFDKLFVMFRSPSASPIVVLMRYGAPT